MSFATKFSPGILSVNFECYGCILLVAILTSPTMFQMVQASSPTISVSPVTSNVQLGEQFTIEVNLDFAESLYAYEVWLTFDPAVLMATAIDYPGYLGTQSYVDHLIFSQLVNNTGGYVTLAVSRLHPYPPVTGGSPPPLAKIHFESVESGTSPLHFSKTVLVNEQTTKILHETIDGTVQVEMGHGHDVAVTDIVSSKTVVCEGCSASFNITVQNQGEYTETFDVAVYANTSHINTEMVTLTSGDSAVTTLTWFVIDVPLGNYTIRAEATLEGDIDLTDNILTDGVIPVCIKGDIDNNRRVNILDISIAAMSFGSKLGEGRWVPNADLNEDQQINILDISIIAMEFGKEQ